MPPRLKSQHTTCPQGHRGSPKGGQHGCSRAGGNCALPCCNLARRGPGVSPVCVAKSPKEAVSPAGCAGAKPPPSRKTFSQRKMCFLDGMPNCSSSMPFFRVLPPFLHSMCASQKPGTPGHWPSDRWRGTPSNYGGMRTDGGGFAPPCRPHLREQLDSHSCAVGSNRATCTQQLCHRGIRRDASGRSASAPRGKRSVPSGRAFLETGLCDGVGSFGFQGCPCGRC